VGVLLVGLAVLNVPFVTFIECSVNTLPHMGSVLTQHPITNTIQRF